MRIVLISCVSQKADEISKAKDLYISPWFKYAMNFAEKMKADQVFILSAKYGLLNYDDIIAPYNKTLLEMNKKDRLAWSEDIIAKLKYFADLNNDYFYFLAGEKYREYIMPELKHFCAPLSSLSIGKQLAFFKNNMEKAETICACEELHAMCMKAKRYYFPYTETDVPKNGIYLMFQKNELGHQKDRIVRVGTHNGDNQLCSRLKQHFILENKNRSIFRKNIGRSILAQNHDPYINIWELDSTSKKDKKENQNLINIEFENVLEKRITDFIQSQFSFVIIEESDKKKRLELESRIVSTVSRCSICGPSDLWLGNESPKDKIKNSGLWQVNELYKAPLEKDDLLYINKKLI